MAGSSGIPGIAVGMAGLASLLIYAGFRGTDPLDALRDVATGKPKGLQERAAMRTVLYEGVSAPGSSGGPGAGGSGVVPAGLTAGAGAHPEFVEAAKAFVGDKYSQARRWQKGYSDCSSFVGKALKRAGVTPPGGSTTTSYLTWSKARQISRDQIGAGDFLVSSGHMALALSNDHAVGQQNGRQNVQVGPIKTIMWGQAWVPLRYTGSSRGGSART
ncbi:NlpC/P60 family protein [Streptomyces sp. NPDC054844]